MNKKTRITEQIAIVGLFAAFAAILSYIEVLIPFNFYIPGVKIGLANIAVIVIMYIYDSKQALYVNLIRIFIVGLLFGNVFILLFSATGAVLSFIGMSIFKRTNLFTTIGVSVIGGVFHNLGQMIVAGIVIDSYSIINYIPVLIVSGIISGVFIGIMSSMILRYLDIILKRRSIV